MAEAPEKFGGRQRSRVGKFLGSGGGGTLDRLPPAVRRPLFPLTIAALALLYPTLLPYLDDIPAGIGGLFPAVGTVVIMLVFTMMAVGLNVVVGYCGLLDLGYVAFYAAGAYTAAWFASQQFEQVTFHLGSVGISNEVPGIHLSIFLILILAGCFTALVGIVIGLPTLRLRGDYLAIVTLGFGEIVPQFVRNADSIKGFDLTHGAFGIAPIDSPGFGESLNDTFGLPVNYEQSTSREEWYFYTALAVLLLIVFTSVRLRDSRLGRAWVAIREDETAAAAMGVPLMRTKTWSYAIGAFFGGIAGAYYASFRGGAFPSDFFFNLSVFILCMVILGGLGSVWGAIVGGLFLSYLDQEGLSKLGNQLSDTLNRQIDVPKYNFLVYGVIIVVVMLLRPTGLIAERRHKRELEEGVHDESLYGVQHYVADILVATDVRKEFGGLTAVNDVDFTIPAGAIVSLIGPNGAGKTTFFNMLTGVYKPTAGRIDFDGSDITGKPPHAITQRGIGRTFQNIRLFQQMTAVENVLVGMHSRLSGGIIRSVLRTPGLRREERAAHERARELLRFSGLRGSGNNIARNLSYGDQRRLEVARALATEPKLLLLDEPTAGMNPQETASFTEFVAKLRGEQDLTVLMIEHDMKVVMGISDRVTVLDYGEKIAEGPPQEVQNDERVIEAYLGRAATTA